MSKNNKSEYDYFEEGREAHRRGKPWTANPHSDVEAAHHWGEGWECEQKAAYGEG